MGNVPLLIGLFVIYVLCENDENVYSEIVKLHAND